MSSAQRTSMNSKGRHTLQRRRSVKRPATATNESEPTIPDKSTVSPTPASKKPKDNEGGVVQAPDSKDSDYLDVALDLGYQPGARIEVYWTIMDEDSGEEEISLETGTSSEGAEKKHEVERLWWAATLTRATGETHLLTENDVDSSEAPFIFSDKPSRKRGQKSMKVPVYELKYDPMEKFGYPDPSIETVVFVSEKTLLNLSTDEMMYFKAEGAPNPPMKEAEMSADLEEGGDMMILESEDAIRNYLDAILQSSLERTGMNQQMKTLSAAHQALIAEKIKNTKDMLQEKIMGELSKMEQGEKVVNGDVIRRCVAQMGF